MKLQKIWHAFLYSLHGGRLLFSQRPALQELAAAGLIALLFWWIGARPSDYLIMAAIVLLMLSLEAINTAIEEVVDRVSPEISEMARNAKDLGSFAVFCIQIILTGWVIWVVLR